MGGRRRWVVVLGCGASFVAGALTWEAIRLTAMNRADREDLVDQMIDARMRAHPTEYPALRIRSVPTPMDLLTAKAAAEFERCGGRPPKPASTEFFAPAWTAEALVHDHDRWKEIGHRSEMAVSNDVFALRRVQLCRSFGGCGPDLPMSIDGPSRTTLAWDKQVERASFMPTTWANAEPFVLSLACGMGLREKQGLPSYSNEARLIAADKAWEVGRTRRCATGEQTACP